MSQLYANTISGLLQRRAELMADARELRERMAIGCEGRQTAAQHLRAMGSADADRHATGP